MTAQNLTISNRAVIDRAYRGCRPLSGDEALLRPVIVGIDGSLASVIGTGVVVGA
jgi:hypothetical protein